MQAFLTAEGFNVLTAKDGLKRSKFTAALKMRSPSSFPFSHTHYSARIILFNPVSYWTAIPRALAQDMAA